MVTSLYANWALITLTVAAALLAFKPKGWVLAWLVVACYVDGVLLDAVNFSTNYKPNIVHQQSLKNT